jgi:hypothetical protein
MSVRERVWGEGGERERESDKKEYEIKYNQEEGIFDSPCKLLCFNIL